MSEAEKVGGPDMRWRLYVESKAEPTGAVSYLRNWEDVLTRVLAINPETTFEFRITEYDPDGQINMAKRDLDGSGGTKA